jgi:hypothetical protein
MGPERVTSTEYRDGAFGRKGRQDRAKESVERHEWNCGYSSTLSSSFFLPQSEAAWTNAITSGCGFFGLELS